jgi:hypothetical protein
MAHAAARGAGLQHVERDPVALPTAPPNYFGNQPISVVFLPVFPTSGADSGQGLASATATLRCHPRRRLPVVLRVRAVSHCPQAEGGRLLRLLLLRHGAVLPDPGAWHGQLLWPVIRRVENSRCPQSRRMRPCPEFDFTPKRPVPTQCGPRVPFLLFRQSIQRHRQFDDHQVAPGASTRHRWVCRRAR